MFVVNVSLLVCLAVAAYGFPEGQIVGGREAPVGKFPYQVSLRKSGYHVCGGSVINERYILTAAHCVSGLDSTNGITVHAGTNQLNSDGQRYNAERIISHSGYNSNSLVNDIALIRVGHNIAFNNLVKPIKLASGSAKFEGDHCVLSGWGTLQVGGTTPNNLQYIDLVIETQAKCKKAHWRVKETHICTFTKRGQGACHGDSGGPLVINGKQVGIVSFGQPCGVGKPDVYTRVSSFVSWINNQQKYLMNEQALEQPADAIYIS